MSGNESGGTRGEGAGAPRDPGDFHFVHPCRVKSFRKAVSAVMDDLELYYPIIEQLALALSILINLCSKLAQLQQ